MRVGGLFDGIGLLAYGLHLAGLEHAWLCEVDPWRRTILNQRFPGVPVFDDVRSVGAHNAEPVHVIAGGFPCKGASSAGPRNGFDHPETVLWREMFRIVGELRPRYVLIENVANLLAIHDGAVWGEVLGDLAALGYDTTWDCLPAAAVGAPHRRDRVFAVATHADGQGEGRYASERSEQDRWTDARGGARAASDSAVKGLEGTGLRGRPAVTDHQAVADPERERGAGRRATGDVPRAGCAAEGEARQRQRRGDAADDRDATPADTDERELSAGRNGGRGDQDPRHALSVDWGDYAAAVRRWEAIAGPAPEPLVRRMDDRSASRVERSRLSALGDGVQVQVAEIVGAHIVDLERRRMTAMSPTRGRP